MSTTTTSAPLRLSGLHKSFGDVAAVEALDLEVEAGSICALLGPSGCGKTTTLRLIAGLERPDRGEIAVGERMLSGNGDLSPRSVAGSGWSSRTTRCSPISTSPAMSVTASAAGRTRAAWRRCWNWSGLRPTHGAPCTSSPAVSSSESRSRARSRRPGLVLLDEPFSNLDAALRDRLRGEVREILLRAGVTTLFVTHDQAEALSIAESVVVMNEGRVEQVEPPRRSTRARPRAGSPHSRRDRGHCGRSGRRARQLRARGAPGRSGPARSGRRRRPPGVDRGRPLRAPRTRATLRSSTAASTVTISCSS